MDILYSILPYLLIVEYKSLIKWYYVSHTFELYWWCAKYCKKVGTTLFFLGTKICQRGVSITSLVLATRQNVETHCYFFTQKERNEILYGTKSVNTLYMQIASYNYFLLVFFSRVCFVSLSYLCSADYEYTIRHQ